MTDSELTVAILREIRDRLDGTNHRLDALTKTVDHGFDSTNARLDHLSQRVDVTNERLSVVETVLEGVAEQVVFLGRYVKNKDAAIEDLRKRVARLEKKKLD